jgi:hypothetical protein
MELEHFCKQYKEWQKKLNDISFLKGTGDVMIVDTSTGDPVGTIVELREMYLRKIDMVVTSATESDSVLAPYILKAVTEGLDYNKLRVQTDVPCNQKEFYRIRRRFFYILSQKRN